MRAFQLNEIYVPEQKLFKQSSTIWSFGRAHAGEFVGSNPPLRRLFFVHQMWIFRKRVFVNCFHKLFLKLRSMLHKMNNLLNFLIPCSTVLNHFQPFSTVLNCCQSFSIKSAIFQFQMKIILVILFAHFVAGNEAISEKGSSKREGKIRELFHCFYSLLFCFFNKSYLLFYLNCKLVPLGDFACSTFEF